MIIKKIGAIAGCVGLLIATSASANEAEYSKFLAISKADGVTTTFTLPVKWDHKQTNADTIRYVKDGTILIGNARLNLGPKDQNLSVSADKISYKQLRGQKVGSFIIKFTLEGHVVFNLNRNGKRAVNFTADNSTFDLIYGSYTVARSD